MLTYNAEELENCIKNIDSVADLEPGHVYMICIDDTKLNDEAFMNLARSIQNILYDLHVKCIVLPSSFVNTVYEMNPTDSK